MDIIEALGKGSTIQHGKHNDRVYLMKLADDDMPGIIDQLGELARENRYSKIFCKVQQSNVPVFLAAGYLLEATIPGFYKDGEDAFLLSKFLSSDRLLNLETEELMHLSNLLKENDHTAGKKKKSEGIQISVLNEQDVDDITQLFALVFKTYPFPVFNPGYILKTMKQNVRYFGAWSESKLVALASAEMDKENENAEMTDFATHPDYTGKGLAAALLKKMEKRMKQDGIKTLYTIARTRSIPMNKTFLRAGYSYTGTLIKNTNISGTIESMNIYFKKV